ncbi:O-antigen ligase family protein [Massilia yuzhufengensis]|uniref:O-Antigen ligase n=1 Tax=Massilia yuzhufengensis TaxID=1164594 RepID=A0A1I1P922_9BURK|nr:O-antigen ligase family protein [Massilia yuzhufengensis]SFD06309.1 O-Antigen ligase [Massilia yuzhufengensis]
MNEILPYIYYSLPWAVVLGLSLAAVAAIGIGIAWPRLLVYPYLAIYFCMNSTSYGNMTIFATRSIYSRGSGLLFFGLLLWYVLGAWACARVAASFQRYPAPACNLRPWFWGWFVLLLGHVSVGLVAGVTLAQALSPQGFSNIVWMAPLISLMLLSFRTREHVLELTHFILLAGLCRALFGLVRWAAFGGDPNNVYANMNAIKIRLTYFDINDSLVCTIAFAIAAVHLFQAVKTDRPRSWRAIEWMTLVATALCILLSYRRSAWIGFMLAFLVIMMRFPMKRRIQLMVAGLPLVGAALAYVAVQRLGQTRGAGGGLGSLVYDMQSRRFGAESERVLELKFALADFLSTPITGIGSWGRYTGYQVISWQNNPEGGLFLHSGVLHVMLKTGLLGGVLMFGTLAAFILFARRALTTLPPELLGLATAGVAGLAFMIPDFLIGTPIPQVRTSQMLAICLALPYLAMAVARAAPAPQRVPHTGVTPFAPRPRLVSP